MIHLTARSSILEARRYCLQRLRLCSSSNSPGLDADLLVALALNCERIQLFRYPENQLDSIQTQRLANLLHRREQGEPMAYIVGQQEFYSRSFEVNSDVLIPRADTEILVEATLSKLTPWKKPRILEVGCGSGCIAISLALECKHATVDAWDIDTGALWVARRNAKSHNAKVNFFERDALTALAWNRGEKYHVMVSNPPYISCRESEGLSRSVRDFEPHKALFAAENGLAFYKAFASYGANLLLPGGIAVFEFGSTQKSDVIDIFTRTNTWRILEIRQDLGARDRVIVLSATKFL